MYTANVYAGEHVQNDVFIDAKLRSPVLKVEELFRISIKMQHLCAAQIYLCYFLLFILLAARR
jgi:hypothetical protein